MVKWCLLHNSNTCLKSIRCEINEKNYMCIQYHGQDGIEVKKELFSRKCKNLQHVYDSFFYQVL